MIFQTSTFSEEIKKAYFAGGCFWCMEESFEKKEGVLEVISGYSGGTTKNPTYEEVTYGNSGHFETIEIIYEKNKINYEELLNHFWKNIDPFDEYGQFCDKGYSYRSVAFYENDKQKDLIEKSITKLEKKFNKKIVEDANIQYVSNLCIKQEYQKLFQKSNPVFPALKNQ